MYHYTMIYVTNKLGLDTPLSECPRFHTHASTDAEAIDDLYNNVPDILSGQISKKIYVTTRRTT